jgi:hypothetical protein
MKYETIFLPLLWLFGKVYNEKAIIHQILWVRFNYSCSKWNLIKVFFSFQKGLDGGKFMLECDKIRLEIINNFMIAENATTFFFAAIVTKTPSSFFFH